MGVSTNVYLGPYLQYTDRKQTKAVKVFSCPNKSCEKYPLFAKKWDSKRLGKFCSACGGFIEGREIEEEVHVSTYDIVGDNLADFHANENTKVHRLGPNLVKGTPRSFYVDSDSSHHEDLRTVDREAEIAWFEEKYAEDIAKIREAFDDVQIGWGIHQYFL